MAIKETVQEVLPATVAFTYVAVITDFLIALLIGLVVKMILYFFDDKIKSTTDYFKRKSQVLRGNFKSIFKKNT